MPYNTERRIIDGHEVECVIDTETGEIAHLKRKIELFLQDDEYIRRYKKKDEEGNSVNFNRLYRTNLLDIVMKKRLTLNELGFFIAISAFIDWQSNYLVHPQTKQLLNESSLAALLDMPRQNVNDYCKRLNAKGMLALVNKGPGRPHNILLNSNIVFFGSKIKDPNDHKNFDDCPYKPVVYKRYSKERAVLR